MVDRRCRPDIFRKMNDFEARVDIASEDLGGPIPRCVVYNDDLKRKSALQPADAVETVTEISLAIVDVDDDRDTRMAHDLELLLKG